MEIESGVQTNLSRLAGLSSCYPVEVMAALGQTCRDLGVRAYAVGGTVRDLLMGRPPGDLDLTVEGGAHRFCRRLMSRLGGGAFVELGTEDEEGARVVWQGLDIDVSSFRGSCCSLIEDLGLRDFTINCLAVPLPVDGGVELELIDPLSGLADIAAGVIRHCARAFDDDPLRLLRAYRFAAVLDFRIASGTEQAIENCAPRIAGVAAERLSHELHRILATERAAETLWRMHGVGLLRALLPELYSGVGVAQPGFHHLDVFHHNFQALREMEQILAGMERIYPGMAARVAPLNEDALCCLKWAALLHDVGKPGARGESEKEAGRVTFYGHDELGRELVETVGARLKWSNEERQGVGQLVAMHMHPFHLCTARKGGRLTRRAVLKLCDRAGSQLEHLFLLAMADSLAGQGELKPETMEQELVDLYHEVIEVYDERIRPVLENPPLLGGRDLIEEFRLTPGPVFSEILSELKALRVEGVVNDREEALAWVGRFLEGRKDELSGKV